MTTTIYRDVPAHRYWNGKGACATKMYRRIMAEIERCLKAGGAVEMDQRRDGDTHQHGAIVEYISVRLDWAEGTAQ